MPKKENALSNLPMSKQGGRDLEEDVYCIGNGQLIEAMTMSYEVSRTLNCMHDPMAILIIRRSEDDRTNNI